MNDLGKQERQDREELASKNEELESALEANKEAFARLEGMVPGYEASQGTRHETANRKGSSGSGGNPKSNASREMKSLIRKRGKEK